MQFADIVPISTQLEYFLRVMLAAVFGGVIGYERKNRMKEAGVRTHMIVCLGSALMMVVSKYGFADVIAQGRNADPSRIASQIVSGIGFLGAGMIFIQKSTVKGLTTAAGIWATAGIGMTIGSGMYVLGMISAIAIVVLQVTLRNHPDFFHIPTAEAMEIQVKNIPDVLNQLKLLLNQHHIRIMSVRIEKQSSSAMLVDLMVKFPPNFHPEELLLIFNDIDYILSIEI